MIYTHIVQHENSEKILHWCTSEEDAYAHIDKLTNIPQDYLILEVTHYSESEIEDLHDEMIDECCDIVTIGSLKYSPSEVLKAVDPIAYRCSISDHTSFLIEDGDYIEGPDGDLYSIA